MDWNSPVITHTLRPIEIKEEMITKGRDKTHKLCWKCHELKPVEEFYRSSTRRDGRKSNCKACSQKYSLNTKGKVYIGLHKRPFPLNSQCELCSIELGKSCYHHFNDNNPSLGIWVCPTCDYLAEGIDEIDKNPQKVDVYHRLKEEVEEAEKTYIPSGTFSPPDGIRRLYSLNGQLTHKWCSHCGEMKPVKEYYKYQYSHDGLVRLCKECLRSDMIGSGDTRTRGLHKRPGTISCELCNNKVFLHYHHWDDNNKSKGVWVCQTNKCHNVAEVIDKIDNGNSLPNKYSELKQRIILEDAQDARISNLEKRVTILEAENVLLREVEKPPVLLVK